MSRIYHILKDDALFVLIASIGDGRKSRPSTIRLEMESGKEERKRMQCSFHHSHSFFRKLLLNASFIIFLREA